MTVSVTGERANLVNLGYQVKRKRASQIPDPGIWGSSDK